MSLWKRLLALLIVASLAACGGGGGSAGTPILGGGSTGTVADIVIVPSADSIPNTGTSTITATITVVDANRVGMKDVPVTVAIDNNAVVTTNGSRTDASGQVVATIGIGSDRSNRELVLTARSGSVTRSATIRVVTDPNSTTPTAADLSLALSAPSLTNGGTSTITATATAVDANRNVIAGIPVRFEVNAGATAAPSGTVTNASGVVTAAIGIGADRSNRVVTVTATSGSLTRTAQFIVTGARLTASASPLVVAGSTGNVIEYTLVDFNAIAMVDQTITVSAPGLPTTTGKTDLNGKYRFTYNAPASPGLLEVVASGAGDQNAQVITVSAASAGIAPAPEVPQSVSVTPTPSVVGVNVPGSSTNQVELRVLAVGAGNKPVPRVRVRFDLAGNANNSDGVVSWVGSYAYTDDNGIARGTFTPSQRSSPTNGVTIRACYDTNDFGTPSSGCAGAAYATTATLTVSSEALAVNIRTNELIKSGAADLTYIKEFVVMVVDAAGQAKPDVQITPSVDLTGYYKGEFFWSDAAGAWVRPTTGSLALNENYRWNGSAWERDASVAPGEPVCPNEDVNRNGVREAGTFTPGAAAPALSARQEDLNWNGDLDPRKSDVAIKMVGSSKTDANGLAIVQIEYGRNLASWVDFVITVTASGVSGTEARARYIGNNYGLGNLPYPATAVTVKTTPPAFVVSPYGRSSTCTDDR
jgi:hypothetical protein